MPDMIQINRAVVQSMINALQAALGMGEVYAAPPVMCAMVDIHTTVAQTTTG